MRVPPPEVRPREDHRGVNLISDALPYGRLWYGPTQIEVRAPYPNRSQDRDQANASDDDHLGEILHDSPLRVQRHPKEII